MVKAKFNGDAENSSYQCDEFNAGKGNTISMPNARWDDIVSSGKSELFTVISNDAEDFPTQTTIGPRA